eukprot:2988637-Prymnesium_polylepis.1
MDAARRPPPRIGPAAVPARRVCAWCALCARVRHVRRAHTRERRAHIHAAATHARVRAALLAGVRPGRGDWAGGGRLRGAHRLGGQDDRRQGDRVRGRDLQNTRALPRRLPDCAAR